MSKSSSFRCCHSHCFWVSSYCYDCVFCVSMLLIILLLLFVCVCFHAFDYSATLTCFQCFLTIAHPDITAMVDLGIKHQVTTTIPFIGSSVRPFSWKDGHGGYVRCTVILVHAFHRKVGQPLMDLQKCLFRRTEDPVVSKSCTLSTGVTSHLVCLATRCCTITMFCCLTTVLLQDYGGLDSLALGDAMELVELTQDTLDDLWKQSDPPYPEARMRHLLDVIG